MIRLLTSTLIVLLVSTATVGATVGFFSDTETSPSNSAQAGTLDLNINTTVGKPFNITDMKPGDASDWAFFSLGNPGSLPLVPYFRLDGPTSGSQDLYDALEIDIHDSGFDNSCGNTGDIVYHSGPLSDITGVASRILTNGDPNWSQKGYMPSSEAQILCQRIRFPDTGQDQSSLEGLAVTFDEFLDAEQVPSPWPTITPGPTFTP